MGLFYIMWCLYNCLLNLFVAISNPQGARGCSTEPKSHIVQACRSICTKPFQFMMLMSLLLIHQVSRSTAVQERVAVYPNHQWVCSFSPIFMWSAYTRVGGINILSFFTGEKTWQRVSNICWWEFPIPCWGCSHDCKSLIGDTCALVEVSICLQLILRFSCQCKFDIFTGASLWICCDGGAATWDAYTNGVLPHGIRLVHSTCAWSNQSDGDMQELKVQLKCRSSKYR